MYDAAIKLDSLKEIYNETNIKKEMNMYQNQMFSSAYFSDLFFNSPEAEKVHSFDYEDECGGEELKNAVIEFKKRVFHPWTVERLCKDFMRRL